MHVDTIPGSITAAAAPTPVRLCDLCVGDTARVHLADVDSSMARFLRAVGLTGSSELRLCKNGEPCIVQVRTTRIGLSRDLAQRILVVPTAAPRASA